jgi:hypothetical protein
MAAPFGMIHFLKTFFADGEYQEPQFANALGKVLPHLDDKIVKRSKRVGGFVVLPNATSSSTPGKFDIVPMSGRL